MSGGSVGHLAAHRIHLRLVFYGFQTLPQIRAPSASSSLLFRRPSLKHPSAIFFFFCQLLPLPEMLPPSICLVKFNPSFKAQLRCHLSPWLECMSLFPAPLGLPLSLITFPWATGLASQILVPSCVNGHSSNIGSNL